jgi:CDP-paratose 2-epimerase
VPRVLITGGAGFVGANLAVGLAQRHPEWGLVAFDNLHRRGSALNLPRLEGAGVEFVRGDVRDPDALAATAPVDALVECSAEPSALTGIQGDTEYPVHTNLTGAYNCLELARKEGAGFVFLSTSRVYPYERLNEVALEETATRFEMPGGERGVTANGISEDFPLDGARTLYGATKLAAELLVTEYRANFGVATVVNRCGVIAGPWQMGKVDQGVFTHWMLHHVFARPLNYIGYGGTGKQVRDLLHVEDLVELIDEQLLHPQHWSGMIANVGGGRERSLSLCETTEICRELTGTRIEIGRTTAPRPGDVPVYISDCSRLYGRTEWRPARSGEQTLRDIFEWVAANRDEIAGTLGFED